MYDFILEYRMTARLIVVQSLSCIQLLGDPMGCSTPGFPVLHTISWSLLKLMFMESMMQANHFILCYTILFLPSIFSSIRVFSSKLALCIRWPRYWRFSISCSDEYSGLNRLIVLEKGRRASLPW